MERERILFKRGYARKFLVLIKHKTGHSLEQLARMTDTSKFTLYGLSQNKLKTFPESLYKRLCLLAQRDEEHSLQEFYAKRIDLKLIMQRSGRKKIGSWIVHLPERIKMGGENQFVLDTKKVAFSLFDKKKGIKLPTLLTHSLAEEMGIHCGDGFLSEKGYGYRLKGNKKDEVGYYMHHIRPLYKKLFCLNVSLREYESTYGFELRSKALWEFKKRVLGLTAGKKDAMRVPTCIKRGAPPILCAFIRGVFDTDGTVYFSPRYGRAGYYPIISVTMKSYGFMKDVYGMLTLLGFKPKKYKGKKDGCWCIHLNGYGRFMRYANMISWNSPKHLNKVEWWKKNYPHLWRPSSRMM